MKSKLPQCVKVCLWSYDTKKMKLSDADNRTTIIFQVLNHGSEDAIQWLRQNVSEKQIKEVIEKSYASAWFSDRLKRWIAFYNVKPLWRTRVEYIMRNEKDFKLPEDFNNLWPNGGHTI